MDNHYIYLFIRKDLSHPQQIIQTAHAVDELNKQIEPTDKTNYMVLFDADCEKQLIEISQYLFNNKIHHHIFYEPDIEAFTAIATSPINGETRDIFKDFSLKR